MKRLLKLSVILFALGIAAAIPPFASADTFTFTFSASDGSILSGTLIGTLVNPGTYAITNGSATLTDSFAGGQFAGNYSLLPNPNSPNPALSVAPVPWFIYDDLIDPGAPKGDLLDVYGLLFSTGSNGLIINIWGNGTGQPYTWNLDDSGGFREGGDGQFSVSATPEPASLLLLGTGLLGLATILFRRAKMPAMGLRF